MREKCTAVYVTASKKEMNDGTLRIRDKDGHNSTVRWSVILSPRLIIRFARNNVFYAYCKSVIRYLTRNKDAWQTIKRFLCDETSFKYHLNILTFHQLLIYNNM